jgi:hypothetical protein
VSLVILFLITIEFFAKEAIPITFQFTFWGFTEKLTFKLGELIIKISFIELEIIVNLGFRVQKVGGWGKATVIIRKERVRWKTVDDILCSPLETYIGHSKCLLNHYGWGRSLFHFLFLTDLHALILTILKVTSFKTTYGNFPYNGGRRLLLKEIREVIYRLFIITYV